MRKSAQELAATPYRSESEFAQQATTFRRLASGLRNSASYAGSGPDALFGLDEREMKTLLGAAAVLEKMAAVSTQAAVIGKKREEVRAARERDVRAAMAGNFGALTSAADQVALIAAVNGYLLMHGDFTRKGMLECCFNDAITGIAHQLSDPDKSATSATTLVDEAWARFVSAKASLQAKHQSIIDALPRQSQPGEGNAATAISRSGHWRP